MTVTLHRLMIVAAPRIILVQSKVNEWSGIRGQELENEEVYKAVTTYQEVYFVEVFVASTCCS